jgi:tetratricopeptide (TPR) repeat protein
MFQKPKVAIAFTPDMAVEEPPVEQPAEGWANTPARKWALAVLLGLLCAFTFAYPTINGAFLPGDDAAVKNNAALYDISGLKVIWGSPQRLAQLSPVSNTILLIEHQFFASRPRGYHVISILVHACNVILLWTLLRRLELPGAWLGAALFAVHPVQVDAVSWISQQRYLICGLFYFCALLVYLRRVGLNPQPAPPLPGAEPLIQPGLPESPKWLYAISIALFLFALFCHVLGATFPPVVLILIWWERGKLTRQDVVPLIPFAVLSVSFAGVSAFLYFHRTGTLWLTNPGPVQWIVIWGRGVWTYFLATLLPVSLSFAYPRWGPDSMKLWHWALPLAAVFVVAALWYLRRRWGRGPITAALLFICLLLPSALGASDPNDNDLPGVMIREHVLYLACAAILVPLAVLLIDTLSTAKLTTRLAAISAVIPSISMAVILTLAIVTFLHSKAYEDPTSIWQNVLHGDGDSGIALNTLGQIEFDKKDYSSADQHFVAALRANPDDTQAQINLARVSETQGQFADAVARYLEVLHRHPDNVDAHFGYGEVLGDQGNTQGALQEYATVQQLDPRNALVFNNIGLLHAQMGDPEEAMRQYKKSIALDPRSLPAYLNLANTQFQAGKVMDAKDTLQKALQIDPTSYIAWLNAGVMAEAIGDMGSAEKYFRAAIYYNYQSAESFMNLGMVLLKRGDAPGKTERVGEAIYCFKHAAELDPDGPNTPRYQQMQDLAQRKKDAIIAAQQQQ